MGCFLCVVLFFVFVFCFGIVALLIALNVLKIACRVPCICVVLRGSPSRLGYATSRSFV